MIDEGDESRPLTVIEAGAYRLDPKNAIESNPAIRPIPS